MKNFDEIDLEIAIDNLESVKSVPCIQYEGNMSNVDQHMGQAYV